MAAEVMNKRANTPKKARLPRAMAARVDEILAQSFAYMDSPIFKNRNIEKELFTFDEEPKLPMTSWYQPTREDLEGQHVTTPQLMSAAEERLMFRRFNY